MKIALCRSHFFGSVSGADEILLTYAICLRRAGHDVDVVLLYKPRGNDHFCRRLRQSGVRVRHIVDRSIAFAILRNLRKLVASALLMFHLVARFEAGLRKIWRVLHDLLSLAHYRTCRAWFAGSGYSILHAFTHDTGAAPMIRAGRATGIPVLYHAMGTPHDLLAREPYYRRLEKVLPLCSEVAALSPILARQWSERFRFLSPVTVLPSITEDASLLNVSVQLNGAGAREIIFGSAARIEMDKGPAVLAEALALVRQHRTDVHVRLAGTGPAAQEVKARARELGVNGSWEYAGPYEGTVGCSAFMRTLDVFVVPSIAEGTSKSVIEAMSHGLPAITTDVGGLPDVITSESGILVPAGDSRALADAMLRLASDPALRKRMGQAARRRYLELFAPEAVLPMLTTIYSRVAGMPSGDLARPAGARHPWSAGPTG